MKLSLKNKHVAYKIMSYSHQIYVYYLFSGKYRLENFETTTPPHIWKKNLSSPPPSPICFEVGETGTQRFISVRSGNTVNCISVLPSYKKHRTLSCCTCYIIYWCRIKALVLIDYRDLSEYYGNDRVKIHTNSCVAEFVPRQLN